MHKNRLISCLSDAPRQQSESKFRINLESTECVCTYLIHYDCSINFVMAANYDNNLDLGMDQWVHDFVADNVLKCPDGPLIHRCMVDRLNLNYPHRIHRCQLGWVEEILKENWNKKKVLFKRDWINNCQMHTHHNLLFVRNSSEQFSDQPKKTEFIRLRVIIFWFFANIKSEQKIPFLETESQKHSCQCCLPLFKSVKRRAKHTK